MSKSYELQADLGLDFEAIEVAAQDPDCLTDEDLGHEARAWLPILARAAADPSNMSAEQLGALARQVLPELVTGLRLAMVSKTLEAAREPDQHAPA